MQTLDPNFSTNVTRSRNLKKMNEIHLIFKYTLILKQTYVVMYCFLITICKQKNCELKAYKLLGMPKKTRHISPARI